MEIDRARLIAERLHADDRVEDGTERDALRVAATGRLERRRAGTGAATCEVIEDLGEVVEA